MMARFRVRLNGIGVAGPNAELIARRLLCEPHDDVQVGTNIWCVFRSLSDGQIEGYVGLLRSHGVQVRYLEILDDKALRSRVLERPLAALIAAAESED